MAGNQLPTKTGYVYKTTTNSDLVVNRMVHLFPEGKFHSFHSFEKDPNDRKSWYLDKHCQLSPENASDIHQARRKHERQQGTWTITATMVGAGRELDLYLFTVVWPKSWFNKGYSTFTMGSESLDEARAWHAAIQASISMLKAKKAKKGDSTPSFVPSSPRPSIENSVSSCRYQLESLARSQGVSEIHRSQSLVLNLISPCMVFPDSARFSELNMAESPQFFDPLNEDSEALKAAAAAGEDSSEDDMPLSKSSFKRSSTLRPSSSLSERWVPYKQTNGVAVYYLDEPSTSLNGMGGEVWKIAINRPCFAKCMLFVIISLLEFLITHLYSPMLCYRFGSYCFLTSLKLSSVLGVRVSTRLPVCSARRAREREFQHHHPRTRIQSGAS